MRRALVFAMLVACKSAEPETSSYYERTIAPILGNSCSRQTTGCHVETEKGTAVGNLDTTLFERLNRRRDLLVTYGPYPYPGLLQKVIGPASIQVSGPEGIVTITTDVKHAAFAGLDSGSDGFATLQRWLENGASKSNVGKTTTAAAASGPCRASLPPGAIVPAAEPPAFAEFVEKVQPILGKSCSAGSCHGAAVADLALTCGDTDEQRKWNARVAAEYLSDPPEQSELLRRALATNAGGAYHSGGEIFASTSDERYQALLAWAKNRGPAKIAADDDGLRFFATRVQPMLVKKGCMFMGCHSSLSFHEYGLRGGAGGRFSLATTRRNYELSLKMLALEAPDPHASRLFAKNLFAFDRELDPAGDGIRHRGGPLLEDFPASDRATPALCEGIDAERGDLDKVPPYCVLVAWHKKERARAIAKGVLTAEPLSAIVYVSRPPDADVAQDFDRYRPGARLHLIAASLVGGDVKLGAELATTCALGESADIRRPAVSFDGRKIAFAARASASEPLAIYTMNADGTACARHETISSHPAQQNGILVHDFDPAWAPDGRLVFASTRGAIGQSDVTYSGPTRTYDLHLNSNLYVLENGAIRQLTFMLSQELAPDFKRNGQLIFTVEKRAPSFYQLAARRQNLDGSDYHPLFAQRKSVGYEQLLDVRQLPNGDLIGVFSNRGATARSGVLGIANRSIGPDQFDRDPNDRFFLSSLTILDRDASYRGPAILPSRSILASYGATGRYAVVQIDFRGRRTELIPFAGRALIDVAAVFPRVQRSVFSADPNDFHVEPAARDAVVRNLDLPMLASLFFDNRRGARTIDTRIKFLGISESLPPPLELTSLDSAPASNVTTDAYGKMWIARRSLGAAPLLPDGSVAYQMPGGIPFVVTLLDDGHDTISTTLEEVQLYPGERAKASFRRQLFDANCGGCHGAISGREVDVHLMPDVMTEASRVAAIDAPPFVLK
jgi:hypothetical protein